MLLLRADILSLRELSLALRDNPVVDSDIAVVLVDRFNAEDLSDEWSAGRRDAVDELLATSPSVD